MRKPILALAALAALALAVGCKDGMSDPTARDPTEAEKAAKAQRGGSLRGVNTGAPPTQVQRAPAPMTFKR